MKQTEKLNNGKYLMTLSFGEVLAKDTAKTTVNEFIRNLFLIRANHSNEYQMGTDGTVANLLLDVDAPTYERFANRWARLVPNGKCQIMSFSSLASTSA